MLDFDDAFVFISIGGGMVEDGANRDGGGGGGGGALELSRVPSGLLDSGPSDPVKLIHAENPYSIFSTYQPS